MTKTTLKVVTLLPNFKVHVHYALDYVVLKIPEIFWLGGIKDRVGMEKKINTKISNFELVWVISSKAFSYFIMWHNNSTDYLLRAVNSDTKKKEL